ncbi:uncharacterized protein LOC109535633 [Dendroctonus ponderosae]|uniref:Small ribosomal subunit protein uS10m n=1 Tax=Dendroctonus ponderosae TaxID=77166 RepID=U4U690_DENPD|nr:uncharacterized protein LOC109535633 [Dendroctonus ponderosae]ERL89389.1 hypothetical protein D910_06759 [Dendroctonus ponderosae]
MKGTILAVLLFTLFSNSFAINDTDVVYEFVNCTIRAMTSGIEGLVPPHNPLHIRNFNITEEILGLSYHIEITNNVLAHLVDVELRQVDVTTYTNPDALNIDYDIYWKVLNFTGDYAWSVEFLGAEIGGNGSYSIAFDHTDFTGLFNLTKPGQADKGIKTHLDDFTLNVSVKEVENIIRQSLLRNGRRGFATLPNAAPQPDPVQEADKLIKTLELEIRSHEPAVLKSYCKFVVTTGNHFGIDTKSWSLRKPVHERYTVLKSVHIYKKHRVQYEKRTYFGFVQYSKLTGSTADTLLEYVERNLPEGVSLKATKVEVQQIPDHLKPS